jgi:hypothetical protein
VEQLPRGYFVVADNAYVLTNRLIVPYKGTRAYVEDEMTDFNFYLLQLCIRIEQAFGLLVGKWHVFIPPLQVDFDCKELVVNVATKLHNFCINKRVDINANESQIVPRCITRNNNNCQYEVGYTPSTPLQYSDPQRHRLADGAVRDELQRRIADNNIVQRTHTRKRKTDDR